MRRPAKDVPSLGRLDEGATETVDYVGEVTEARFANVPALSAEPEVVASWCPRCCAPASRLAHHISLGPTRQALHPMLQVVTCVYVSVNGRLFHPHEPL